MKHIERHMLFPNDEGTIVVIPSLRTSTGRRSLGFLMAALTGWAAASCAPGEIPVQANLESPAADVQECASWFAKLDKAIDTAGVRDAEAYRIPGFPYLRVNRFLASFRHQAQKDPAAFSAWEKHLRDLDARTRSYEIKNLPQAALMELGASSKPEITARADRCAISLAALNGTPAQKQVLTERAQVPDDYIEWQRDVGLYPAVSKAFFEFAKGWQNESAATFQRTAAGTVQPQNLTRYQPPESKVSAQKAASIVANAKTDAIGVPQFSDRDREMLFNAFAPVYEIETKGDFDRIGPLRWGAGTAPEVDISRQTVYRRVAFTRFGGRTLTQLVYMIWFPERPQSGSIDPTSGQLDGIIFRVTLDQSGRPLVYDSIHNCGCYHMFFPTQRLRAIPSPDPNIEWAFIPRTMPDIEAPQRVVLRATSGNHFLIDARSEAGGHGQVYTMVDDGELRTLPVNGGTRSAYGPTGVVPGTERAERLLTWPLGIENNGAMREWGRHATALVGRRQFDDADLIEKRFEIVPGGDAAMVAAGGDKMVKAQERKGTVQ